MTTETKSETSLSLLKKRELLRLEMRIQRQLIAQRLGPDRPADATGFPRSKTMRFLRDRPGLAGRIALELGTVLVGAGFIKSFRTAFGFAKMLR